MSTASPNAQPAPVEAAAAISGTRPRGDAVATLYAEPPQPFQALPESSLMVSGLVKAQLTGKVA